MAEQKKKAEVEELLDQLLEGLSPEEALGGELHLVAEFPDGSVEIKQFENGEAA